MSDSESKDATKAEPKKVSSLNGKTIVRVNLLDNAQKVILVEDTTTVQDVVRIISEKLGFENPSDDCLNYSLHEVKDGVTIERALPGNAEVVPIQNAWEGDNCKFVFQIKLFTTSLTETKDPKIIYTQHIQAVYHVISGIYPLATLDDVSYLGALQLQNKFGDHNPDTHKAGFLKNSLLEYIPNPWFHKRSAEEWEELLFARHAELDTTTPEADYVNFLSKRDYYGCTLFGVKQLFERKWPKTVLLGVNHNGIMLLKPADMVASMEMITLATHNLSDIYRWAYKPGVNFYFEMKPEKDGDENPVYTFQTREGQHIADMLTDYAMGLLREMGLNPDGSKRDPRDMGAVEDEEEEDGEEVKADEAEAEPEAEPEAAAEEPAAEAEAEEAPAEEAAGESGESDLPAPWVEVKDDESGDIYFYNNDTGESSWEKPTA